MKINHIAGEDDFKQDIFLGKFQWKHLLSRKDSIISLWFSKMFSGSLVLLISLWGGDTDCK